MRKLKVNTKLTIRKVNKVLTNLGAGASYAIKH